MEQFVLRSGDRGRTPPRPKSRAEQGLVGVDVPHAPQQLLIEEGALDRSLASAEQGEELILLNFQWFDAARFKISAALYAEPAETARINKPQFAARTQLCDRVRVLDDLSVRPAHHQAPRHAEMNDPLCPCRVCPFRFCPLCGSWQ